MQFAEASLRAAAQPSAFLRPIPTFLRLQRAGSWPSGFCGGWDGNCFSARPVRKLSCFAYAACRKFLRTSWWRCLTPDRAEFSRHAGEVSAGSPAEQPIFEAVFGRSSPARRLFHPPQKPGGTGTLLRSIWTEAPERLRKNAWALEGAFSLHICAPNVPDLRPCVFYTIISADIFYLQRTILNQEIYEQENALALQV